MKVLFDLVINHCSDQHKWFKESRSSVDSPKRNWFIWRKPKGWTEEGKPIPPNNWRAAFGGSVWEWDEPTQEYYLHLFAVGQPDFVSPVYVLNAVVLKLKSTLTTELGRRRSSQSIV